MFVTTLLVGLSAGTLNLLGAFAVYGYLLGDTPPGRVLQSVARGVFGNAAFVGGARTAYWGLFLHYAITLLFTGLYTAWYRHVPLFSEHPFRAGVVYGVAIWVVMNVVVLPLSRVGPSPFDAREMAWGLSLIVFLAGLPIALLVHRALRRR